MPPRACQQQADGRRQDGTHAVARCALGSYRQADFSKRLSYMLKNADMIMRYDPNPFEPCLQPPGPNREDVRPPPPLFTGIVATAPKNAHACVFTHASPLALNQRMIGFFVVGGLSACRDYSLG